MRTLLIVCHNRLSYLGGVAHLSVQVELSSGLTTNLSQSKPSDPNFGLEYGLLLTILCCFTS